MSRDYSDIEAEIGYRCNMSRLIHLISEFNSEIRVVLLHKYDSRGNRMPITHKEIGRLTGLSQSQVGNRLRKFYERMRTPFMRKDYERGTLGANDPEYRYELRHIREALERIADALEGRKWGDADSIDSTPVSE